MIYIQGVPKKTPFKYFWERLDDIYQNCVLILKLVVYPRHLKKEVSILSRIEKSYMPGNFCNPNCSKKHLALNSLKTVLMVDLHLNVEFQL